MQKKSRNVFALSLLAGGLLVGGCANNSGGVESQQSTKATGAAVGAAVGAAAGALSGDDSDDRRKRALIGAGVGALAGLGVGAYMDQQEARLRNDLAGTGVSVERRGGDLVLNMPGSITFDVGRDEVQPGFFPVLDTVSAILNEYNETTVNVTGHTDNTGNADFNQLLSQRRAESVGTYLQEQNVEAARILTSGAGSDSPVADNATDEGRQENRRVELVLTPVEEPVS